MATLLMCRPRYYGIEYEINPWMSRLRPADPERATRQWHALYCALTSTAGMGIELLKPAPGLPDLVFTANAGLVEGDLAVVSNFTYPERAREEQVYEAWFASRGFRTIRLPRTMRFEGEGDALVVGDSLFGGYGFRTDEVAHAEVAALLGKNAISLQLVHPYFYHLDTCFCPLGKGRVMYYPDAFTEAGCRTIEEHFPERYAVSAEEARRFVCNSVVIGDWVVLNTGCPAAERRLTEWGYKVVAVDTSEFIKAGGSAKCLTLFLERSTAGRQPAGRGARRIAA